MDHGRKLSYLVQRVLSHHTNCIRTPSIVLVQESHQARWSARRCRKSRELSCLEGVALHHRQVSICCLFHVYLLTLVWSGQCVSFSIFVELDLSRNSLLDELAIDLCGWRNNHVLR